MSMDLDKAKRKLKKLGYSVTLRQGVYIVTIDGYPVRDGRNKFTLVELLTYAQNVPQVKQQELFT